MWSWIASILGGGSGAISANHDALRGTSSGGYTIANAPLPLSGAGQGLSAFAGHHAVQTRSYNYEDYLTSAGLAQNDILPGGIYHSQIQTYPPQMTQTFSGLSPARWYTPVEDAVKEAAVALEKRCQIPEEKWIRRAMREQAALFGQVSPREAVYLFEAIHVAPGMDFYLHCTCPHWREAKRLMQAHGGAYFGEDTENPPSP